VHHIFNSLWLGPRVTPRRCPWQNDAHSWIINFIMFCDSCLCVYTHLTGKIVRQYGRHNHDINLIASQLRWQICLPTGFPCSHVCSTGCVYPMAWYLILEIYILSIKSDRTVDHRFFWLLSCYVRCRGVFGQCPAWYCMPDINISSCLF
jgi:hypothetical protein